jgi:hypothetical protein
MYTIAKENRDLVVRVPGGSLDDEALAKFLDYLELETIRRRSRLSDEEAKTMADDIDRSIWNNQRC